MSSKMHVMETLQKNVKKKKKKRMLWKKNVKTR